MYTIYIHNDISIFLRLLEERGLVLTLDRVLELSTCLLDVVWEWVNKTKQLNQQRHANAFRLVHIISPSFHHLWSTQQVDNAYCSSLPYPHCRGLRQRWMICVFANKVSFCSRFSVGWPRLNTDSIMVWTYQPCIYFLYTGKLYIKFPPLLTTVSITDTWEGWLCLSWVYDPRLGALLLLSPPPKRPIRHLRVCKSPIGGLHLLLSSCERLIRLFECAWPPD